MSNARWQPTASKQHLEARAQTLAEIRQFFAEKRVLEVQTPLLGAATVTDPSIEAFAVSGSAAQVGFLQTSTEYHQKRLLAAGIGDNYTLGPVFRADEQGRFHNPEFTMLEWYRLGFDDEQLMRELSELVDLLLGADSYQRVDYAELVASQTSIPSISSERPNSLSATALSAAAREEQADLQLARALEALGKGRYFVVGYPAEAAVLARLDPLNPTRARRFELVIDGVEIANGYFELTDADAHADRFAMDNRHRRDAGQEEVVADQSLLAAVAVGLPDCAGVAVGFDRLLMLRLGVTSIEDVQAFGWLRR